MKKVVSIFFSLTLLLSIFCNSGKAQDSAIEQYIQKYRGIAVEEMERTGVPAAISLAQGILESQAGQGWLVERSHNHFGIKCKADWTGQTILYDDDKRNECFRVYATDDSSWRDHSDFLKNSPRYASLFQLNPLDYKAWARGLKKAGYATSKVYAEKLIGYIEKYNLQQYTETALANMHKPQPNAFALMLEKKLQEDKKKMGVPLTEAPPVETAQPEPSPYPEGEFTINGRRVIYARQGTPLMDIADKYHIRLARLLRFNEMDNDVLTHFRLIYLQKKGKRGAHDIHIVSDNESMASIAAAEGIRLKWLYKWNYLSENDPLKPGDALYLQGYRPRGDNASAPPSQGKGFLDKVVKILSATQEPETDTDTDKPAAVPETTPAPLAYQPAPQVAGPAVSSTDTKHKNSGESHTTYQVQSGDTLYSISRKYNITVSQIKQWNDLDDDHIRTGQQLIVKK